jgi:hypothetical protein
VGAASLSRPSVVTLPLPGAGLAVGWPRSGRRGAGTERRGARAPEVLDQPLESPRFRRRLILSWNLRPVQSSSRMRIAVTGSAFPLRRRTFPRPCGFSHPVRPEPFAQFRSRLSSGFAFLQSLARSVLAKHPAKRRRPWLLS